MPDPSFTSPIATRNRRGLIAVAAIAMAACVAVLMAWHFGGMGSAADPAAARSAAAAIPYDVTRMAAAGKAVLKDVTPETAISINASRPVDEVANPAARAFQSLAADSEGGRRSLDCLTAAIYYEAANEPADGQRAVAQVVLNRVRHPAYPSSVCGVVFQGYRLSTGCQFSFTCDGSLARIPVPAIWQRARAVAEAALAGAVYKPAGLSTHYHADYVVPFWASSLDKVLVVGRHIFYRINSYGSPRLFSQAYARTEPLIITRQPSGAMALVNDKTSDDPAQAEEDLAMTDQAEPPIARPILNSQGQSLAMAQDRITGEAPGDPGKGRVNLSKSYPGKEAKEPAAAKPAEQRNARWVLGMPAPAKSAELAPAVAAQAPLKLP